MAPDMLPNFFEGGLATPIGQGSTDTAVVVCAPAMPVPTGIMAKLEQQQAEETAAAATVAAAASKAEPEPQAEAGQGITAAAGRGEQEELEVDAAAVAREQRLAKLAATDSSNTGQQPSSSPMVTTLEGLQAITGDTLTSMTDFYLRNMQRQDKQEQGGALPPPPSLLQPLVGARLKDVIDFYSKKQ